MNYKFFSLILFLITLANIAVAQNDSAIINEVESGIIDYSVKNTYEIAEIKVVGVKYLNPDILAQLSGLKVGQKISIPGDDIANVIKKFWKQGLFSDVKIYYTKIEDDKIYLEIFLKERPRLANIELKGIKKSDQDDLKEKIELKRGMQVTDNIIDNTIYLIKKHFIEKGFLNTEVNVIQKDDSMFLNMVNIVFEINKHKKVKVKEINFIGLNTDIKPGKLRRAMKETKRKRIYNLSKPSKYVKSKYDDDKNKLIEKLNEFGYRDARIIKDSVYVIDLKNIAIDIYLEVGKKYYFRNIKWIGNTKYSSSTLDNILNIKKGDIYDQSLLNKRLFTDEDGVSTLYLDNGYLFFQVTPVEVKIEADSIDLELRITEGEQAVINNVIIEGNTKTNENVIRRELRTRPGELFSKTDITRSIRELANLGHFDPEKLDVVPIPDPARGTVDLKYKVEEKSTDQFEISGGYGSKMFIGTVGVRFSNFSIQNVFNKKAWRPIPSGDGQTLSIKVQATGKMYQSYNISFAEPWFGGKKPNSLVVSLFYYFYGYPAQYYNNYYSSYYSSTLEDYYGYNFGDYAITNYMRSIGVSVGLGRRLKWPDDYFLINNELSYEQYRLKDYNAYFQLDNNGNGKYNLLTFKTIIARNSVNQPIYPRSGSNISLAITLTPPYSFFNNINYADPSITDSIRHKWVEYHKWVFKTEWYLNIVEKLVFAAKTNFGIVTYYNKEVGYTPFDGFDIGVDPMTTMYTYGRDRIPLRGFKNGSITPIENGRKSGNIYTKYTAELRYPISLNPQATVYALIFAEAGNAWSTFSTFNPFSVKRTGGVGLRAYLPMFGLIGLDYGYRFDGTASEEAGKGEFHFVIGQEL